MPLNYLQCENAKPQLKPYRLADGKGLYLQVMPNGSRYWQYRFHLHSKQRCLSLGIYPQMSLSEARQAAKQAKDNVQQHIDPVLKRKEEKQLAKYNATHDLKALLTEWHEYNKSSWTARHAAYVLRRLEIHVFPELGSYPSNNVPTAVIAARIQKIEKDAPEMARRVLNMLRRAFKYGGATGRCSGDPTFGLESVLRKYKSGHYAAVTLDELPVLVRKIYTNDARLYRQTHLCLKLMLLTAVRTCELIEARWSEFDLDNALWVIPPERMKTRKLHKVPLSRQALVILNELKALNGKRDFVFPSISRPRKAISNATILKALDQLGYKYKMTGHGFRSILMGVCKQHLGYRHEPVDRQLAHVPRNSVDRAYDRADYLPERIVMMQQYADFIDHLINSPTQRTIDEQGKNQAIGKVAPTFNSTGYSARVGYQISGFTQSLESRTISETTQGRGEPDFVLVERGNHTTLQ